MHNAQTSIPLICPLDHSPLVPGAKQLRCEHGHSFDIAKQGYVNLLPVQHKRSRDPGDSKAMVTARREFLASGVYLPIADALCQSVNRHLPEGPSALLDAGCGEGYYLQQLAEAIAVDRQRTQQASAISLAGLDISKWAVMAAAKRQPGVTWMVASNRQIPVADDALDLLLCCFGFNCFDAFARVLKPGGKVILADAGPEHLVELRSVIYPSLKRWQPPKLDAAREQGFEQIEMTELTLADVALDSAQLQQLMTMTPHLYRANAAGKQAVQRLTELSVSLDVQFRVLQLN